MINSILIALLFLWGNSDADNSEDFWSPIDVVFGSSSNDPTIVLCKLNFKAYSASPHSYSKFKDLVKISGCSSNSKKEKLSKLMTEKTIDRIPPTAFIFHESRVGSTLVANVLASTAAAMVYSEPSPTSKVLMHCPSCSRERTIQLFRDVVSLMGRSTFHDYFFIKFQSIATTTIDIILEAFPDTPWAFIYRKPVQTMMSHLDPAKGGERAHSHAVCLRSRAKGTKPPSDIVEALKRAGVKGAKEDGNFKYEAWCAAHLAYLCAHALRADEQFGHKGGNATRSIPATRRGVLVDYEALPGAVARVMFPIFGVQPSDKWLQGMVSEAAFYSKSSGTRKGALSGPGAGGGKGAFTGDSEDKEMRATEAIRKYSALLLQPSYDLLTAAALSALRETQVVPTHVLASLLKGSNASGASLTAGPSVNWGALKEIIPRPASF